MQGEAPHRRPEDELFRTGPAPTVDAAVVGGGPVGLATALLLARHGFDTALVAPRSPGRDARTSALLAGSLTLLKRLGIWPACVADAHPLCAMRLVDDTGSLFRAPTVLFEAAELGLDAFGWNLPYESLVAALETAAAIEPNLLRLDHRAERVEIDGRGVSIRGAGSEIRAALVVGAEGAASPVREAAGIAADRWSYPQTALAFNIGHERAHEDVSTEFHRRAGPLVVVPLPGRRSSVVLVDRPDECDRLLDLPQRAFDDSVSAQTHWLLGRVEAEPQRSAFRLSGLMARRFARGRAALVGEAAHRFPPIGAQGLNLGLRDAAMLTECLVDVRREGADPLAALARYDARRRADVASRVLAVDLLNRSLLGGFLPLPLLRSAGLALLDGVAPLRRMLMREGLTPSFATPRLMRDEAP
jgi:2-octaprenyl-6-methoxyphenol hydroxylase